MLALPNINQTTDRALCAILRAFPRPSVGLDFPQAGASCFSAIQGKIHSRKTLHNGLQGIFSTPTISAYHWARENGAQVNFGCSSGILPVLESRIWTGVTGVTRGDLIMRSQYQYQTDNENAFSIQKVSDTCACVRARARARTRRKTLGRHKIFKI